MSSHKSIRVRTERADGFYAERTVPVIIAGHGARGGRGDD